MAKKINQDGSLSTKEFFLEGNNLYQRLIKKQHEFLDMHKSKIPSEYLTKWPVNKLSWWSRHFETIL